MSKSKEPNSATVVRKKRNVLANLARAEKNRDKVAELGLAPQQSLHTKTTSGRDGKPREFTVVKDVRASKLLRSDRRAIKRLLSGRTAAAIHTANTAIPKVAAAMVKLGESIVDAGVAQEKLATAIAARK